MLPHDAAASLKQQGTEPFTVKNPAGANAFRDRGPATSATAASPCSALPLDERRTG